MISVNMVFVTPTRHSVTVSGIFFYAMLSTLPRCKASCLCSASSWPAYKIQNISLLAVT